MRINKEGYKIIFFSGVVCLLIWWGFYRLLVTDAANLLMWGGTVFLLLFWFFIVAFFREPRRVRIHDADLVFAPCDGRVVVTEVVMENEYLKQEMLQISIFMSITNVHMNWVPVGGRVEYFKYHPGRFLVAWHPKSSTENERTTTVVRMDSGQPVLFRQIAGLIARRIVSYMKPGEPWSRTASAASSSSARASTCSCRRRASCWSRSATRPSDRRRPSPVCARRSNSSRQ